MNITSDHKPYQELSKEELDARIKRDSEKLIQKLQATFDEADGWKYVNLAENQAIRPSHYGGAGNTYEVFNVLEAWGIDKDFYLGNVIKYISRAGKKDSSKTKEDLEKALVYLQRRISSM